MSRSLGWIAATAVVSIALSGCGSKSDSDAQIPGRTLTIYSSAPLHGASAVSAQAVINGEQMALAQVQGRVGKYRIVLKSLDDSNPQTGVWDPGQTTVNARVAATDKTTVGYLGEFNSGASAVSIPLLNRVEIPQLSPASTAVGLTYNGPGASEGEPEKYYPTGIRTFARVVPNDAVQASAQVRLQKSQGCTKTYVLDDGEVDGHDMAVTFSIAAQQAKLPVVSMQQFDPRASDYSSLATTVAQSGATCVMISAITESNAVLLVKQIAAAMPSAQIFASAGVAESTFANPAQGGVPEALDGRVLVTVPTVGLDPPTARAFYAAYTRSYGAPQPYAIYGYEAMSLLLSAIDRATDHGRRAARRSKVVAAIFHTRNRRSVLGEYSIQPSGDTTLRRYGVYRIVSGQLSFWTAIPG